MSDVMLLGVLRMPFDDHGDLHIIQLRSRCLEAADRIESDEKIILKQEQKIDELERKISDFEDKIYDMQEEYANKIECIKDNYEAHIEELEIQLNEM